ncbi:ACT domain-containing protein [Burkholderiaceae bacterium DAT-1]|nr:ACT domain-containing protein [Burkholderiaceae bacterium DAT-1]
MSNRIEVTLDNQAGALERLLRVVRHRGYQVASLNAQTLQDAGRLEVQMDVLEGRPLQNLIAQLAKLAEVRRLSAKHRPISVAHS